MELLDEYNATSVLHDMPKAANWQHNKATFAYIRFHGIGGTYKGNYDMRFLKEKAKLIRSFLSQGKEVFVYFNNTIGSAYQNALELQGLLKNYL